MGEKKALVLCGGGAKGAYHIGVWKALQEIGYEPDIITGTSVGALNGALFTIGKADVAEELWKNMSMDTVFEDEANKDINSIKSVNEFVLKLGKIGGIDPKPLKETFKSISDEEAFKKSKIEFGLVTTQLKPIKRVELFTDEIEEGKIADYVLASTACFPIMQKYSIDGVDYIDGGYTDNVPFNMALDRGATELVIVDMHGMYHVSRPDDVTAKIHYVSPKEDLGNFMIFNKKQSLLDMQLGYMDTLKVFGKLEGTYYAFNLGSTKKANEYNGACRNLYKRIFTDLPKDSALEKLAKSSFYKCIKNYNEELFCESCNVLDILEIAAEIYEVDLYKIYSFEELANEVHTKYLKSIESEIYKKIMSLTEIKKSMTSFTELKKIFSNYDRKELSNYIAYLFTISELTMMQKNQILAITAVMPECLCAAILVSAFK